MRARIVFCLWPTGKPRVASRAYTRAVWRASMDFSDSREIPSDEDGFRTWVMTYIQDPIRFAGHSVLLLDLARRGQLDIIRRIIGVVGDSNFPDDPDDFDVGYLSGTPLAAALVSCQQRSESEGGGPVYEDECLDLIKNVEQYLSLGPLIPSVRGASDFDGYALVSAASASRGETALWIAKIMEEQYHSGEVEHLTFRSFVNCIVFGVDALMERGLRDEALAIVDAFFVFPDANDESAKAPLYGTLRDSRAASERDSDFAMNESTTSAITWPAFFRDRHGLRGGLFGLAVRSGLFSLVRLLVENNQGPSGVRLIPQDDDDDIRPDIPVFVAELLTGDFTSRNPLKYYAAIESFLDLFDASWFWKGADVSREGRTNEDEPSPRPNHSIFAIFGTEPPRIAADVYPRGPEQRPLTEGETERAEKYASVWFRLAQDPEKDFSLTNRYNRVRKGTGRTLWSNLCRSLDPYALVDLATYVDQEKVFLRMDTLPDDGHDLGNEDYFSRDEDEAYLPASYISNVFARFHAAEGTERLITDISITEFESGIRLLRDLVPGQILRLPFRDSLEEIMFFDEDEDGIREPITPWSIVEIMANFVPEREALVERFKPFTMAKRA